jgi:4a-hydroxytetrahydrobiopterin dehydratase
LANVKTIMPPAAIAAAELVREPCVACRPNAPRLSEDEIASLQRAVPDWRVEEVDGVLRLVRRFSFPNFARALAFSNAVGALAEAENHHPALLTEWGRVTVSWWTHAIGGLHRNDVLMAAKTDQIAAQHKV